ncbi:PilZ domain-containing protein [Mariprofundus sp. KV]|uniref:PilZ domain-containing protein n=1 Tax=Mariprofundus sp. KV TaxID=2608715 RepID=UPI0015A1D013|nr:PilZ domain-containing protein [Mariprofundus sp. KV]NWF36598.1 PilZ domain-containing protein [Mariprofundus sp. KV]
MKQTAQFAAMVNALKAILGDEHPLAIAQLARHICRQEPRQPLDKTVTTLLHNGYSIAQLLSALLQCESRRMKSLFSGHSALPLKVQIDDLRQTIHAFNEIQDTIMEVGEQYLTEAQARNIRGAARLPDNSEDRISEYAGLSREEIETIRQQAITAALDVWCKSRSIRLFNQFRGIPINASAHLLGKGKDKIRISLDREVAKVFASHPDKNRAFLSCPNGEQQIATSIIKYEPGSITLKLEDVSPSYVEKRRNLGVQVADNIRVKLSCKGRSRGTAQLYDLSISGFGFIVQQGSDTPVPGSGEELDCEFILSGERVRASGWIRWQQNHEGMLRLGMELKSDRGLQQMLQQEIFRLQRSIIVAMNEIDIPKELRDALPSTGMPSPPEAT